MPAYGLEGAMLSRINAMSAWRGDTQMATIEGGFVFLVGLNQLKSGAWQVDGNRPSLLHFSTGVVVVQFSLSVQVGPEFLAPQALDV